MDAVQTQTYVESAVHLLVQSGCQFKIIVPGGAEFGELVAVAPVEPVALIKPHRTRKSSKYPIGELKDYALSFVDGMNVGDRRIVPLGTYAYDGDDERLRGACSGGLRKLWGAGNNSVSLQPGVGVEVRRRDARAEKAIALSSHARRPPTPLASSNQSPLL